MKRATIIGHFGEGQDVYDGQSVKTRTIAKELEKEFGSERVIKVDTRSGLYAVVQAISQTRKAFKSCSDVIILPAQNGLKVYSVLCSFFKKRIPDVKTHYVVIGGWLVNFIKRHSYVKKALKSFDGIYVETSSMRRNLESIGFTNVSIIPNCKELEILKEDELIYDTRKPLRLCTFSRVMKEKGIEDATNVVKEVNERAGETVFSLDIFGAVDHDQEVWFNHLKSSFPDFIHYKGPVAYDQSVDALKSYYVLLFPTRFYTEGIPGTMIDAYAAGIPVISSKWENYSDIIEDGKTGFVFEFLNTAEFAKILEQLMEEPEIACRMKKNCIKMASAYSPENAVSFLVQRMR